MIRSNSMKYSMAPMLAAVAAAVGTYSAHSQAQSKLNVMLEEVVVTATKKNAAESVQTVPIAMTAFGGDQLDVMQIRDIEGLSYKMPNVALDSNGIVKGVANFSIRGYGSNSSIVSVEPTVGLFVDGVYMGTTVGVVMDTYDLESVEVLRGPQGTLFGRNVSGGAVLVNTRRPGEEFELDFKSSIETGLNKTVAGGVTLPIIDGELSARLVGYYRDDDGWFKNDYSGDDFGKDETYFVRPSVRWTPGDNVEILLRMEAGQTEADGPAVQGRGGSANFDKDSFDIAINEPGFVDIEWQSATLETNFDVDLGNGTITNIFGYRSVEQSQMLDLDGYIYTAIHTFGSLDVEHFSNELRYSGNVNDNWTVTAGLYYFEQDIASTQANLLVNGAYLEGGGGEQEQFSYGVFVNNNLALSDEWTLNLGLRYTYEEKDARVQFDSTGGACEPFYEPGCSSYAFPGPDDQGEEDWSNVSPLVGVQYFPSEDVQLYASWSVAYRSGGYNLRQGDPNSSPGPVDEEELTAYEVGVKSDWLDRKLRINAAYFYNDIEGLQRAVFAPDEKGIQRQTVTNAADAVIQGAELEAQMFVSDSLLLNATIGYLDGEYHDVAYDLNADSVIDAADESLKLTRLAPWTATLGLTYDRDIGDLGAVSVNTNYSFRDAAAYTDSNDAFLPQVGLFNASIAYTSSTGAFTVTLYGKNLTDEVTYGAHSLLPDVLAGVPTGGSFIPLNKGRVAGVSVDYRF
ncbi:TonB-dependent receptor [Parahaliea mediterranea]|uniref:TonB-dependent receptor n=1 Tax=Parahaliea mediterranea TaxID=651086 RepID=A0A939IMY7_9GAMM|nr:TonB-dependent receptor [Parahaliea mediterranea]MBN7797492.1 TonB-dependent receptor [Parahaliea mediterranea]